MTTTDTRLAALLLTNRLTRVDEPPLRAREFWTVVKRADDHGIELGSLLGADEPTITSLVGRDDGVENSGDDGVDARRLSVLLAATRALAFEIERLAEGGISLISALDAGFPPLLRDRLQHRCPASLFVAGPAAWLTLEGLAVVGVDDTSAPAHDVARAAVAAAVVAEWSVVTDRATTIGETVTAEALACESAVISIAADGINRAARVPAVRRLVQHDELCLVSPYAPDAVSSRASRPARDTLVHAMAHTTFVTTAHDGTGDTWGASAEAAQREPASVATWLGEGSAPGNQALAALGAKPVRVISDIYALFSG